MRSKGWFYLTLAAYVALVLAVMLIRVNGVSSDESGSSDVDYAVGVVMLFATVGPALVGEMAMRRLLPAVRLRKERRNILRRIRRAEQAHKRAQHYLDRMARATERWDSSAARLTARERLNGR